MFRVLIPDDCKHMSFTEMKEEGRKKELKPILMNIVSNIENKFMIIT